PTEALHALSTAARRYAGGADTRVISMVHQVSDVLGALWLARRAGLRASGLAADARSYGSITRTLQAREVLARVKAVGDVVTGAGPRFLGPRHPIAGDGRTTLG
ncbi:MAG TPA: hypothetical protein VGC83_01915, partial [Solirubrobacteraceae bacterium]